MDFFIQQTKEEAIGLMMFIGMIWTLFWIIMYEIKDYFTYNKKGTDCLFKYCIVTLLITIVFMFITCNTNWDLINVDWDN